MSQFLIDRLGMLTFCLPTFLMFLISCNQVETAGSSVHEPAAQEVDTIAPSKEFTIEELIGKFTPEQHSEFELVSSEHASRSSMYLRKETLAAFKRMAAAAELDGIQLTIISATRNFHRQKTIWDKKWNKLVVSNGCGLGHNLMTGKECAYDILRFSSMPGTSRHHWGTDIDINNLNNSYFESGKGKKEYEWLRDRGFEFGFCQVYSEKDETRSHGYEEEKWHWSYVPLASQMIRAYSEIVDSTMLKGFVGDNALTFAEKLQFVNGIAPECK